MITSSDPKAVPGYEIRFIYKRIAPTLREALQAFWEKHRDNWIEITRPTSSMSGDNPNHNRMERSSKILSNVTCVAFDSTHTIVGVTWVKASTVALDVNKQELVYFQRMYLAPQHRFALLANRMLDTFHRDFKASKLRSPIIHYLMAENVNSKLKRPFIRRLFLRKGFEFVGFNSSQNEIWKLRLPPSPIMPIASIFHKKKA